jgi:hypothetical protein
MTLGSSMLEITFTLPAHSGQVSMSMLNTRPSLWAQVILEACWLAVRVLSSGDSLFFGFGTTSFRYLKFGANTPKNRIKFTLGRGTNEANLASKSSGSSTMCVVPLSPLSCIGEKLSKWIEEQIDWEARHIVLGHLQRSHPPTTTDRFLTSAMGIIAARLADQGQWGKAAAFIKGQVTPVPIENVMGEPRNVDKCLPVY